MAPTTDLTAALSPTDLIDSGHADVIAFARDTAGSATTPRQAAGLLFTAVRDGLRYDPYTVSVKPADLRASAVLRADAAWCVQKAILLTAASRALEIPARVGFADVRNHLSTPKLRELMNTDLFMWHGFAALWLGADWRKASPAFNASLCERFGLAPLEFDGTADALLHAFDAEGRRYMEYVTDRGLHDDVPLEEMSEDLLATYPQMLDTAGGRRAAAVGDDGGF